MTNIEQMAREAGFNNGRCLLGDQISASWGGLEKFAALVAESCAQRCEQTLIPNRPGIELIYANAIREKYPKEPG
jgi:hypothetical protein